MAWIAVLAWILAVVLGLVVLGFAVYEVSWRIRRLPRELAVLAADGARMAALQRGLAEAGSRLGSAGGT